MNGGIRMQSGQFFKSLYKPVIGMIHLLPLPGSPAYEGGGLQPILERALQDAQVLSEGGIDAILLQNTGDVPCALDGGPETVAYMTMIGSAMRRAVDTPIGINILANGTESALAVAHAVEAAFVRIKVLVGAVVEIRGITEGSAHRAQEFIRRIGATNIEIAADVYHRTSWPLVPMPIEEAATYASFHGGAKAVIITGTCVEDSLERLRRVKAEVKTTPVYAGGGTSPDNVGRFLDICDGVVVGTSLRKGASFRGPVDPDLVKMYMDAVARVRAITPNLYPS